MISTPLGYRSSPRNSELRPAKKIVDTHMTNRGKYDVGKRPFTRPISRGIGGLEEPLDSLQDTHCVTSQILPQYAAQR